MNIASTNALFFVQKILILDDVYVNSAISPQLGTRPRGKMAFMPVVDPGKHNFTWPVYVIKALNVSMKTWRMNSYDRATDTKIHRRYHISDRFASQQQEIGQMCRYSRWHFARACMYRGASSRRICFKIMVVQIGIVSNKEEKYMDSVFFDDVFVRVYSISVKFAKNFLPDFFQNCVAVKTGSVFFSS